MGVLEELLKAPCYATPGNKDLVGLFDRFIKAFQTKMSDLRFIKMMQACLQQMDGDEAVAVLEPFLEQRKEEMEGLIGIDAFVFSALYKNLAEIAKLQQDGPRFYKYALLYLAYTPVEDIPAAERSQFSIDVSEAALLAPLEFNFGELLDKPLIKQELSKAAPSHEHLPLRRRQTQTASPRGDLRCADRAIFTPAGRFCRAPAARAAAV